MKKYRRIEITAFRHNVRVVSDCPTAGTTSDEAICINDVDRDEIIEAESDEGRQILIDAVRLLEEQISSR